MSADSGSVSGLRPGSPSKWTATPASSVSINVKFSDSSEEDVIIDKFSVLKPDNVDRLEVTIKKNGVYIPLFNPVFTVSLFSALSLSLRPFSF